MATNWIGVNRPRDTCLPLATEVGPRDAGHDRDAQDLAGGSGLPGVVLGLECCGESDEFGINLVRVQGSVLVAEDGCFEHFGECLASDDVALADAADIAGCVLHTDR